MSAIPRLIFTEGFKILAFKGSGFEREQHVRNPKQTFEGL